MPTFLAILFRPGTTWASLASRLPGATRTLLGHVVPLSLLPAIAWPVGQGMAGVLASHEIPRAFAATFLFSIASVLLVASGLYALAPFFRAARSWAGSVVVAAYSATPVLLSGTLLFVPLLVIASVGSFLYGLGLCALGVRVVLGCREDEVAGYIASAAVFLAVASMALGALCSAIGLI